MRGSSENGAKCRVALIGFGTVGRAVAKILCETDGPLRLTHICNRNFERKKQPWVPGEVIWTDDVQSILNSDVEIVIELIGGLNPAEQIVRRALEAGKAVVTANKQLIARHGPDLLSSRQPTAPSSSSAPRSREASQCCPRFVLDSAETDCTASQEF